MSKHIVTFTGDPKAPRDNPESVTFRGLTFPLREPVALEVESDAGKAMLAKLQGNSHFVVTTEGDEPAAPKAEKPKPGKAVKPAGEPV